MNKQADSQCMPLNDVGFRGLAWIFVGLIYAFGFVSIAEATRGLVGTPFNFLLATLAAPTLTALVYGSMRLVVVIGNVVLVLTLLLLMLGDEDAYLTPGMLVLLPAVLGLVIGAVYGLRDRHSRVCCADAKTVSGLFAGILTLLFAGFVLLLFGSADRVVYPWLVMGLAPLAGVVYMSTACWFVRRLQNLLPPVGDGALVGLGVGAVIGLLFVVIAGTFDAGITGHHKPLAFVDAIHGVLGITLLATAASCFALGALRALLRIPWYRL